MLPRAQPRGTDLAAAWAAATSLKVSAEYPSHSSHRGPCTQVPLVRVIPMVGEYLASTIERFTARDRTRLEHLEKEDKRPFFG